MQHMCAVHISIIIIVALIIRMVKNICFDSCSCVILVSKAREAVLKQVE